VPFLTSLANASNGPLPYTVFFRDKTFRGISRVYEAIRPEAAAAYLGLEEAVMGEIGSSTGMPSSTLVESLTSMGWTWDAEEGLFHPKAPPSPPDTRIAERNGISQLVDLIGTLGD
jgi:COP9 signalosome complex subunit 8